MRRTLALLGLLLAGAPAARAAPAAITGAEPQAYQLDLRYRDRGAGRLTGSERIEFVNRASVPLERVWLRLWANGPDRCRPRRISVTVDAPASAELVNCTTLEVRLGAPVAPGATGAISLRLTVRGRRAADRFGRDGDTALFGNVIPLLAVEDDRGLHLEPYVDGGESFYSLAARWRATLRLPKRLRAATTGTVLSERTSGRTRSLEVASERARDFALAVGPLRVSATTVRGIRVRLFHRRGGRRARSALRTSRRSMDVLSRRLGPYVAGEVDVVLMDRIPLGMEYPELVFSVPWPDVIGHELAHQWWYGIVGNDQFREPWLDESFASYFEMILSGRRPCHPRRPYEVVRPRRRRLPLDASMDVFRRSPAAYGEIVYTAGACALQRLERDIGRARMSALVRLLQSRFRFGVMRSSDVLEAIAEVAPGYDVGRWMRLAHLRSP